MANQITRTIGNPVANQQMRRPASLNSNADIRPLAEANPTSRGIPNTFSQFGRLADLPEDRIQLFVL